MSLKKKQNLVSSTNFQPPTDLLEWYDGVKRDLPWRHDITPYKVWISEIMLQQTQVVTVLPYYHRFMERFPTVESLANANEEEVFKYWEGLGYYSRARNLIKCARIVATEYRGEFPNRAAALEKLPGIGPYTSAAIASIAFNECIAAVDGNVFRVLSRIYENDLAVNQPKNVMIFRNQANELMKELMQHHESRPVGDFNQAMMELGATVCTPTQPRCELCPFRVTCRANLHQTTKDYPVKIKKAKKIEQRVAMIVMLHQNQVLLMRKNDLGLLSDLWGFPAFDLDEYRKEQGISKESRVSQELQVSQKLQISQELKVSQKLQISQKPQVSQESQVSKESEVSQELRVSQASEVSLKSKNSHESLDKQLVEIWVQETLGLQSTVSHTKKGFKHVFTHRVWHPELFFMWTEHAITLDYPQVMWVNLDDLLHSKIDEAISTAIKKQFQVIAEVTINGLFKARG